MNVKIRMRDGTMRQALASQANSDDKRPNANVLCIDCFKLAGIQ